MSTFSAVAQLEQNFKKALEAYTASQNLSSLQSALLSARSLCNFGQTDKSVDAFLALAKASQKNPSDKAIVLDAVLGFAAEQKNDLSAAAQLSFIPIHLQQDAPLYLSQLGAEYATKAIGLIHSYLSSADAQQSTDFYGIAQLYGAWSFSCSPLDPVTPYMTRALQRALSQEPPHYDGAAILIQATIIGQQIQGLPTANLGNLAFQVATEAVKQDPSSLAVGLLLELAQDHLPKNQAGTEHNWINALQVWRIADNKTSPLPELPADIAAAQAQHQNPIIRAELKQLADAVSTFDVSRTASDFKQALHQIKNVHSIGCADDSTNALAYLLDTLEDFSPLMPELLRCVQERLEEDFQRAPLPLSHIATLYNALNQKEVPTDTFYKTLAIAIPLAQEAVAAGLWFQTKDYKGLTALLPVCEQGLEKTEAAALLERASTTLNFMKIARPDAPPLLMALANLAAEYEHPTRPFVQIALGQLQLESTAPMPDTSFAHALTEVVFFHTPASSETYLQAQKIRQRLVSNQRPEGPTL